MKKVLLGVLCVLGLVGIVAGWNQVVSAQAKKKEQTFQQLRKVEPVMDVPPVTN